MSIEKDIQNLILEENLGTTVYSITKVIGGLSHRMYKVVTDKNVYAIKELNAAVMKRKTAYSNFVFSEKVVDVVKENGITAVGAIRFKSNDIIRKINNRYFMTFDWIEGKILEPEEVTDKHCEIIGKILAQIHNIDFSKIEEDERKTVDIKQFDWYNYLDILKKENKSYVNILEQNIDLLYEINKKSNEALIYANENLVISHIDLDLKNVIWQEDEPFIIDWESSGYINPIIELIQVAWYWSGGNIESLDYNKFKIIVDSYKNNYHNKVSGNIEKLAYADIYRGLEWLDYNFKRALCIENNYEQDEIELAEKELIDSIKEIRYNFSEIGKIIEIIKKSI